MTSTPDTDVRVAYVAACKALRDLSNLVCAAEAVRYEAPPGMVASRGETGSNVADVLNPTLDTVLDARRMGLSDEVRDLHQFLRVTAHSLTVRKERLDRALARWEGDVPAAA